jgi:polysaccharide pyruvyl transferase WcaK-like protein
LESKDIDYVGTRLHAGIRALQKGRRALIISVDNRATEIGRDTHLPIVERKNMSCLEAMIKTNLEISLKINRYGIDSFKGQLAAILNPDAC